MTSPLRRAAAAPPPRTLVDVLRATVAAHPDAMALDNGVEQLTYEGLAEAAGAFAEELHALGVGRGDRVGVRVPSGTLELYIAILGTLLAGAAYVPVDADDPEERARVVFGEADVAAVVGAELRIEPRGAAGRESVEHVDPSPQDDCWIIFTSGSTGTPKGVAVSHRSAAAFVDAEAALFLAEDPLGPDDRVMAGLSVAFDASCEEMWLAWRHGGCLVPAPRALVRSGLDVAPWLEANRVTVVSTVPTLVSLWPESALARLRLLILGGEALPPEVAARLVGTTRDGRRREVWNTYGPTEATVVACGARVDGDGPVRIGLPLAGWDLAVVDEQGHEVAPGETGELIIGGVGLARYLDDAKDAVAYAPMPTLGWERAYRSGDRVVHDPEGLLFAGRADDQVKVGGRRIELGEIDSALLALPGVVSAAAAVRRTPAGNPLLVGYLTVGAGYDGASALATLRRDLPAALVPRLAVVAELPTRTSGKVDRDALPWPLPDDPAGAELSGMAARVAEVWREVLGTGGRGPDDDFFDLGGGSLSAAQVLTRLRPEHPELAVGDLYDHPTLGSLAAFLEELAADSEGGGAARDRTIRPTPLKTQSAQVAAALGLRLLAAPRALTWTALAARLAHDLGPAVGAATLTDALPAVGWAWLVPALLVFVSPPGRMLLAAGVARLWLAGVVPGDHPRGGRVHLRLWAAERSVDQLGATTLAGAALMTWYARLLGATVGREVDLHTLPPVTGFLRLGDGCSIEPEVDLSGYWIDGDLLHLGALSVGRRARVGTRSTLCPGAVVGDEAEVAPGSAVVGAVPDGEFWSGAPAALASSSARGPWSARPDSRRGWSLLYGAVGLVLASLPAVAIGVTALVLLALAGPLGIAPEVPVDGTAEAAGRLVPWLVPLALLAALLGSVVLAVLVAAVVRLAGVGLEPGVHPVRGRVALQVWATMRVLDEARTWLFPLYSSQLTPAWLRLLGARIGADVEASTVLMVPSLTTVGELAFLADDTLVGGYELGGGWLRVERVKIGKRSFLGNSGMAAPGRRIPKRSLVAVLSAAPARKVAKAGVSWLGSPPAPLRRPDGEGDDARTYAPARRLKVARAAWEVARLVPMALAVLLPLGVGLVGAEVLATVDGPLGGLLATLAVGVALVLAGAVAALLAAAAKWILVGRHRAGSRPLWSSFVWRNELADTFVETLAAPWFTQHVTGTPVLVAWFRLLGARIGRGVWCESHWLPETDLVVLGDGACVNQGSVVQTHLFHDRVLAMDEVRVERGGTLGPNSVVLPSATIGRHATVGPVSLVMRGESVPDRTIWIGNPIGPWSEDAARVRPVVTAAVPADVTA
ncbi:amino acid adenylation domain-containing protein [Nocardioides sp. TRM66260-LWL]|uniref:Pls/PosA family non-ribosomal peptide synthetase n=1 Tax=Nocardioides sp. TRM66260-LWL TaxID=2874478 RepID=UPI001CC643D1|nr:Pls/PosA family non-ribosomal peptide synthetase [Nocardioides sp. TRM66260-LWL]MBZ5735013.1 amino acid adenylation domain-containing protein [Nocardioides sp. TRM66260-LWL]